MGQKFDIAVIGGGPGGYVAAIRSSQLGKKVAIIDKRPVLGGTCLNVGCIPSKALLDSSEQYIHAKQKLSSHGINIQNIKLDLKKLMKRKEMVVEKITKGVSFLMKKNNITHIQGNASLSSDKTIKIKDHSGKQSSVEADNIVIATGSMPIQLPGIQIDGKQIITSDEAIALRKVPKHLIIVGAGVIGLELGSVWKRLGAKVSIVEFMPRLLGTADQKMTAYYQDILEKQGISFIFKHKVTKVTRNKKKNDSILKVEIESNSGELKELKGDCLLVAVGRKAVVEDLGLEEIGIKLTNTNKIQVNPKTYQTNVSGIYAIGDVIDGPMLAHKASEEGIAVAEIISNGVGEVNYMAIPWVIYTCPEMAWTGFGEEELKEKGIEYNVGNSLFRSNGRALAMDELDGQVKILSDKKTDKLLGLYIIGSRASEMVSEAVLSMEFGASAEDIARSVHAHPTLSEIMKEAAMDAGNWSIHS